LSTFLCIDLTSNWKLPITCRQFILFSYINLIVKLPVSHCSSAHVTTSLWCRFICVQDLARNSIHHTTVHS